MLVESRVDRRQERLVVDTPDDGAVATRVQRAVRDFGAIPSHDDVAIMVLRAS